MNIQSIISKIEKMYDGALRAPQKTLPALLVACSFMQRPGLSTIVSTSNIIEHLSRAGIPTEDSRDGTPNCTNKVIAGIISEVVRMFQHDYRVETSIKPGEIVIAGTVNTPAGPIPFTGLNPEVIKTGGGGI